MMRKLPFLLGVCLLLVACREKIEAPEIRFTADPEFNLDLFEQRSATDGSPIFGLWVESLKNQDAGNYGIQYQVTWTAEKEIEVQIIGVRPPDTPSGAPAPARDFLPVGVLAPGDYRIDIVLGQTIRNTGTLRVETDGYSLSLAASQGFMVQNMHLKKIPTGTLWGYADASTDLLKPRAEAFVSDLKAVTADHTLPTGFYGYFTITGAGSLFLHSSLDPQKAALVFVRQYSTPLQELRAVVQNYRNHPSAPLPLRCLSTGGEL
jgi:hypothetical protein